MGGTLRTVAVLRRNFTTRGNSMKRLFVAACAAAALAASAGVAQATTIFYFFSNTVGNVAGTVTGHIDGLVDNATSAATAVWVDSYPPALSSYSTPFDVLTWSGGSVNENSFTLVGGVVTAAFFSIVGANGDNDQLFLNSACACAFGTGHTNFLDIGSSDTLFVWSVGDLNASDGLQFGTPGVPEPSTWAMMLLGVGALGVALRGSRRRAVSAA
jgi:PEP-CTERM motif